MRSLWARSMRAGRTERLVRSAFSVASHIWSRYSHQCFSFGQKVSSRLAVAESGIGVTPLGGEDIVEA
jgi:hypothetical protein